MLRQLFQRALLLALAALAGLAGAAGPQTDQALRVAIAERDAPYDYRVLNDGGSYYAPGSYGSWFYVAPPASDAVASATNPIPEPSFNTPSPALPTYYDFDRFRGPLFG